MLRILTDPVSSIYPTNGCEVALCFDETEYVIEAGTKASLQVCHDGATHPTNGQKFYIAGIEFEITTDNTILDHPYFVYGPATNDANVHAEYLERSLVKRVEITDLYDITRAGACVTLTTKEERVAPEFDDTQLNSAETGYEEGTEIAGVDKVVKDEYYVFLRIVDNETGEAICPDISKPLNIYSDGSNKVCFELSAIISKLPGLKVSNPDDGLPFHSFDHAQYQDYRFEVYGYYNSTDANCNRIQTNLIEVDPFRFVRFIEQPLSALRLNTNYFHNVAKVEQVRWMTDKPEEYHICKDAPLFLRFYHDMTGYDEGDTIRLFMNIEYLDGFTEDKERIFVGPSQPVNPGPIHILNIGELLYNSDYIDQDKVLSQITLQIEHRPSGEAGKFVTEPYNLIFDLDPDGNCCDERQHFLFQGETGNLDPITAPANHEMRLEVEFQTIGRQQRCGGYDGGVVTQKEMNGQEPNTCWIYCDDYEYLLKFLRSPFKWLQVDIIEGGEEFIRIYPAETDYEVYKKYARGRVRFTYYHSTIKNHY